MRHSLINIIECMDPCVVCVCTCVCLYVCMHVIDDKMMN